MGEKVRAAQAADKERETSVQAAKAAEAAQAARAEAADTHVHELELALHDRMHENDKANSAKLEGSFSLDTRHSTRFDTRHPTPDTPDTRHL